jgi:hypothetical protein
MKGLTPMESLLVDTATQPLGCAGWRIDYEQKALSRTAGGVTLCLTDMKAIARAAAGNGFVATEPAEALLRDVIGVALAVLDRDP